MGLGGMMKKAFTSVKLKKRVFDPEKLSIEDIVLPKVLNNLEVDVVKSMVKEELSTYKSLGYKDRSLGKLEAKSYHSFQIGVILKYLQLNYDLFIPNKEKTFPEFVTSYHFESLQIKVFDIVALFDKKIDKGSNGAQLARDIRWSPLDITYLLYYLSLYKDTNEK